MPTGNVSGSKFFGEERYQQYVDELTAEGTIGGEQLSPDERKEGFKKRNDKIGFQDFVGKVLEKKQTATVSKAPKSLPGRGRGGALIKRTSNGGLAKVDISKAVPQEGSNILEEILKIVTSIRDTLIKQNEFDKKQAKQDRQSAERGKRKSKEDRLEGNVFKGLAKGVGKVLKPVKGLFERVFDFIKTILIGRLLVKLVDWMGNKDNQDKVEAIGKFLSKTWPALLAAYLLFGNGLGRFITKMILMTLKFIPKIGATIFKLAAAHPLAAAAIAGAGLFVAGAVVPQLMPGTVNEQERKIAEQPGTPEEKIKRLEEQKANLNFLERMQGVGAEIDEQIKFLETGKTAAYSGGGIVRGFAGGGHAMAHGTDTVPAMLTPGEFVMSRGAVQKYGSSTLASMNAAGGGTNRPIMLSGTLYAKTGGHVHAGPDTEPAEENRQSAEKQPQVPAGDSYKPTKGGPDRSRTVSGTASVVQPTEAIIPKKDKEKDKVANSWKPILDLIAKYEAVGGSYDSIYPSRTKPGLSKMTIAEADSWQASTASSRGSAAAGRYQFMHIKKQAADAGIGSDAIFSPENQDKMAIALIEKKRKVTYDLMQKNPDEAMIRLGMEWAALPMPKAMRGHKRMVNAGQSYYAGDGKNKAGASIQEVRDAMKGIGPTVGRGTSSDISSSDSSSSISSTDGGGETSSGIKFDEMKQFDFKAVRRDLGVKSDSVSRSSRPTSTAAYQQMQQSQTQSQTQGQATGDGMNQPSESPGLPRFDAAAMVSQKKIKTLGITV